MFSMKFMSFCEGLRDRRMFWTCEFTKALAKQMPYIRCSEPFMAVVLRSGVYSKGLAHETKKPWEDLARLHNQHAINLCVCVCVGHAGPTAIGVHESPLFRR